jgi:hypothetical protein
VVVVGAHAGDRKVAVEDRLEAERHRAVDHLRVDPLAVHVAEADAVEDAADRRLGMDGAEGTLPRSLGLREEPLEVGAAGRRVEVADHEALLAPAVGARGEPVAVRRLDVVEEQHRVLHLVGVGVDDEEAVVHGFPV